MRNRAKCKLCSSVIESFGQHDYVSCKCGEISVDGGSVLMKCMAKDWNNFLRVDDKDNEIIVQVKENPKPTKKELIDILDEMSKNIENLPQGAMLTPINHYDFNSLLILLSSILRAD